jgi:7-carboxy-7-deazaguanine synthase
MMSEKSTSRSLLVSEVFSSIQGEGVNLGTPCVFLRLAICNLHCWYCDTKYTWLYSDKMLQLVEADLKRLGFENGDSPGDLQVYDRSKETRELSLEDVESSIMSFRINHLVVTGGEPMLQQEELAYLASRLKNRKNQFFIEAETNGTIEPNEKLLTFIDQWNVSPKFESSGNSQYSREKKAALKSYSSLSNAFFKFVISEKRFHQDLAEIESLVSRYSINPSKIILMAEGTNSTVLRERTAILSKICADKGYRITPRLHILLWGNKRGT